MKFAPWTKLKEEPLKVGWRTVLRRTFRLPDGREHLFDVKYERPVVVVFALTHDRKVVLAKQYRVGPEKVLLELPGGGIEKGEMPIQAMERELREETGYEGRIVPIGTGLACGYSTRVRHYFVATDCLKVEEPKGDDTEFIEPVEMPLDEFRAHLRSGELTDQAAGYLGLEHLGLLVPAP